MVMEQSTEKAQEKQMEKYGDVSALAGAFTLKHRHGRLQMIGHIPDGTQLLSGTVLMGQLNTQTAFIFVFSKALTCMSFVCTFI